MPAYGLYSSADCRGQGPQTAQQPRSGTFESHSSHGVEDVRAWRDRDLERYHSDFHETESLIRDLELKRKANDLDQPLKPKTSHKEWISEKWPTSGSDAEFAALNQQAQSDHASRSPRNTK